MAKFRGKNVGDSDRQQANYALALATLGGATKNRNDPIAVTPPKVAMACTATCRWHYGAKLSLWQGILKGRFHCTVDLRFDWFRISCMTTDNSCFHLQNRLIQTSQTGGQQYSDTSPFSIPCLWIRGFMPSNWTCK
jgi:hypothetical protein